MEVDVCEGIFLSTVPQLPLTDIIVLWSCSSANGTHGSTECENNHFFQKVSKEQTFFFLAPVCLKAPDVHASLLHERLLCAVLRRAKNCSPVAKQSVLWGSYSVFTFQPYYSNVQLQLNILQYTLSVTVFWKGLHFQTVKITWQLFLETCSHFSFLLCQNHRNRPCSCTIMLHFIPTIPSWNHYS